MMNHHVSPKRNRTSLYYIVFSRKERWCFVGKGLLQKQLDQTCQMFNFAIGYFVHTKIAKRITVYIALMWCVNHYLYHLGENIMMPICFWRLGMRNYSTEEHLPFRGSWLTSQLPLKGTVYLSGPCLHFGCVLLPPPSQNGSMLILHWASSCSWTRKHLLLFCPRKMDRTVCGPIKKAVALKIVLNFLGNNFHLLFTFLLFGNSHHHPRKPS